MIADRLSIAAFMEQHESAPPVLSTILRESPAGFVVIDREGVVQLLNAAAADILDIGAEQSENLKWRELCEGRELKSFDDRPIDIDKDPLFVALRQNRRVTRRLQIATRETGRARWVSMTTTPVLGDDGTPIASVAYLFDITDFKSMQDVLYHQAMHDPLTGLSNRVLFSASLVKALARLNRNMQGGAILALDLDNFKTVNDTLGHAAGDELLIRVAERLRSEVRETDVVARFGGDEFNILLLDIEGGDNAAVTGHIAQRICESMVRPFSVLGKDVQISASLGACLFPADGMDEETLLIRADTAMYHVKGQGRNGWRFWSKSMEEEKQ